MSSELKEPGWVTMFDFSNVRKADGKALLGIAIVGLFFDFAVRSGFVAVSGAILALVTPLALGLSGRVRRTESFVLLSAVPLFGIWLALRTSAWLIVLDVIAACLLLLLASSFARGGSLFNVTIPGLFVRGCAALVHGLYAGPFIVRGLMSRNGERRSHFGPIVRGLLLVSPVVLILGALLASSDKVFASLFNVGLGDLPLHAVLVAVGAWLVATVYSMASADSPNASEHSFRPLPATEALVALGAVVTLFGAFVVTQLIVLSGGADHVLNTRGLTYADHARSGFFQLIAVAVITLALLMFLKSIAKLESPKQKAWFTSLAEAAVALTLVIVAAAVSRLALYEDAYGLTMLRLYSSVFAVWIGIVFVLLGSSLAGVASNRSWLAGASFAVGLVVLFGMNVANPEKLVVQRNIAHGGHSKVPFDVSYNSLLSNDGKAELLKSLPKLDATTKTQVIEHVCTSGPDTTTSFTGWAAANSSRSNYKSTYETACKS